MAERLREVAGHPAVRGVVLLREQPDVVGQPAQAVHQREGLVAATGGREGGDQPEGAGQERVLVAGEPELALEARQGEVVRLYLTNTANTRVFKVKVPGARMKLVGGDSGRYEHEQFVPSVVLAPSERVVVDVQFTKPGTLTLEHHTPDRAYVLAEITVLASATHPNGADCPAGGPQAAVTVTADGLR